MRRGYEWLSGWVLVAVVGLAFADTSIVALALPQIYGEFATTIVTVSWVLTGYATTVTLAGLVLALVHDRLRPPLLIAGGLVLLAAACVGAGLAGNLPTLMVSRCAQGVGAAMLLTGALPVLSAQRGERAGRLAWSRAAAIGLAVGPALGGVLTEVFDWRAIFLAQIPVAVAGLLVLTDRRTRGAAAARPSASPGPAAAAGLVLVSGGLVGALFLSVLMVIEVWRLAPLAGAFVVSALPAGMLITQPVAHHLSGPAQLVAGASGLAGGLAAFALLPAAGPIRAVLPLLVCGIGWALLTALFEAAPTRPAGPDAANPQGGHELRAGAISTAARHAGLVLGLLLIAPVLAGALEHASERAARSGTAIVLDARVTLSDKVKVAMALRDGLATSSRGHVPDVAALVDRSGSSSAATHRLGGQLTDRLRDILTRAFRSSFGVAAALAAGTLLPGITLLLRRRAAPALSWSDREPMSSAPPDPAEPITSAPAAAPMRPFPVPAQLSVVALVLALIAVLLGAQAAAGAGRFGRSTQADPCRASADPYPGGGLDALEQRIVLSTLNGAACSLHVSREALVLSLDGRARLGSARLSQSRMEPALRAGLLRAIDDAQRRGDLAGVIAQALRYAADRVPLQWLTDQLGMSRS